MNTNYKFWPEKEMKQVTMFWDPRLGELDEASGTEADILFSVTYLTSILFSPEASPLREHYAESHKSTISIQLHKLCPWTARSRTCRSATKSSARTTQTVISGGLLRTSGPCNAFGTAQHYPLASKDLSPFSIKGVFQGWKRWKLIGSTLRLYSVSGWPR